jgi:hypothetical protein
MRRREDKMSNRNVILVAAATMAMAPAMTRLTSPFADEFDDAQREIDRILSVGGPEFYGYELPRAKPTKGDYVAPERPKRKFKHNRRG